MKELRGLRISHFAVILSLSKVQHAFGNTFISVTVCVKNKKRLKNFEGA